MTTFVRTCFSPLIRVLLVLLYLAGLRTDLDSMRTEYEWREKVGSHCCLLAGSQLLAGWLSVALP
jgi:hypothetical protein